MERKVHLIDPYNMKILKEFDNPEQALACTSKNAPMSVFIGIEGQERAMFLDEFRSQFGN